MRYKNLSGVPMGTPMVALIKEFDGKINVTPGHSDLLRLCRERGVISELAKVTPSVRTFEKCVPILLDLEFIKIIEGRYFVNEKE